MSLNKALLGAYFLGGGWHWGGTLNSHENLDILKQQGIVISNMFKCLNHQSIQNEMIYSFIQFLDDR